MTDRFIVIEASLLNTTVDLPFGLICDGTLYHALGYVELCVFDSRVFFLSGGHFLGSIFDGLSLMRDVCVVGRARESQVIVPLELWILEVALRARPDMVPRSKGRGVL